MSRDRRRSALVVQGGESYGMMGNRNVASRIPHDGRWHAASDGDGGLHITILETREHS